MVPVAVKIRFSPRKERKNSESFEFATSRFPPSSLLYNSSSRVGHTPWRRYVGEIHNRVRLSIECYEAVPIPKEFRVDHAVFTIARKDGVHEECSSRLTLEQSLRFAGCHGCYWPHNHFVHPRINFRLFPLTFRFLVRSARSIRLILDDESIGKRKPGRRWSIVSWNAEEERTLCWAERCSSRFGFLRFEKLCWGLNFYFNGRSIFYAVWGCQAESYYYIERC